MLEAEFLTGLDTIEYTTVAARTGGEVVQVAGGKLAGIIHRDIAASGTGVAVISGLARLKKKAATAIAIGQTVYWDDSANEAQVTGTFAVGVAYLAAAAADDWVYVLLNVTPAVASSGSGASPFVAYAAYTGAGTVAIFNANAPRCRIVNWWLVCTDNVAGTVKLSNGTNDISAAINHGTTDAAIVAGGTIDDAYHELAAGATLNLVAATGGNGIVYVQCVPIP